MNAAGYLAEPIGYPHNMWASVIPALEVGNG